jgi:ankyrin repeat protein
LERVAQLMLNHTTHRQELLAMQDVDGWTALHLACARGAAGIVHLLLKYGDAALVTLPTRLGRTPLDTAVAAGSTAIAVMLLSSVPHAQWPELLLGGTSVYGGSAWHHAVKRGHANFAVKLLDFVGAPTAARLARAAEPRTGKTTAHLAAEHGHETVFAALIRAAPCLEDAADFAGDTPFTLARRHSHAGVLLFLWDRL